MAERQMAADPRDIRADHTGRYRFAATRVSGDVLDAACGCGYGSRMLADAGARVRGVDLSAEALAFAGEHYAHGRVSYTQADAMHVAGRYDWIVCFETLEHVQDDAGLVRHFATLAPRLIISVPNQDRMPFKPKLYPYHHRHYRATELDALLRGAGWTVREWFSQPSRKSGRVEPGTGGLTLIALAER